MKALLYFAMLQTAIAWSSPSENPPITEEKEIAFSPTIHTLIIAKGDLEISPDSEGVISDCLPESAIEELASRFLGEPISTETLKDFRESVIQKMEEEGNFAVASFPEQDVSLGTVMLKVSEPKIEKLDVKGNSWQSTDSYLESLSFSQGDRLHVDTALNDLAWINRNPFHYVEAVVSPGTSPNSVAVELVAKDRFPLRPFFGADNTGTNLTDQVRIFAGANWGRAFGKNNMLTYQFTTAPSTHKFYAHTGSYLIFLPWKHEMTFFGGYSHSKPDLVGFSQQGRSVQASFRYAIPAKPLYGPTKKTTTFGFDYKNINSNVFFIDSPEVPIIAHQVNISQLFFSYQWQRKFMVKWDLLISPCRLLPNQSPSRYHALRPHSSVRYAYTMLALVDTYYYKHDLSLAWTLRGQLATGPLLPSEQFGLGGYDTVRGYEERDFLADNAACLNIEFRSPKISFFKRDELIFLTFLDLGGGYNYKSDQEAQKSQFLAGIGPGVRYRIDSYLSLRADYGFQLHNILGQSDFGRFHLGGYLSY